jgi:hypothetical protein
MGATVVGPGAIATLRRPVSGSAPPLGPIVTLRAVGAATLVALRDTSRRAESVDRAPERLISFGTWSVRVSGEVEARSYYVYVVELEPALCEQQKCPSPNGRPPVYVGQSIHPPELRFQQHKEAKRSSRYVRKHGVRLLPDLYAGNGPYATRREAEEAEAALASRLRQEGYCVFGGH